MIPSTEVAIVFTEPIPTATHKLPFHATPRPELLNIVVPRPVHVIPSGEVAIVFVPVPTATHKLPFHATANPLEVNTVFPLPVQVVPSGEYAIAFVVPLPTETVNCS